MAPPAAELSPAEAQILITTFAWDGGEAASDAVRLYLSLGSSVEELTPEMVSVRFQSKAVRVIVATGGPPLVFETALFGTFALI